MKVNLSFEVDLEKVPEEIQKLTIRSAQNLGAIHDSLRAITVLERNPYIVHKEVDGVRQALLGLDSSLEEIQTLLSGYQAALTQVMAAPDDNAPEVATFPNEVEGWDKTLSELREHLGGNDDDSGNNEEG